MVPWWFAEKYQVRILDGNGKTLARKSNISKSETSINYVIPFDPPGFGMALQVAAYRSNINLAQTMIDLQTETLLNRERPAHNIL